MLSRHQLLTLRGAALFAVLVLLLSIAPELAVSLLTAGAQEVTVAATCPIISFDRQEFTHPTSIDNSYFPLAPGTQLDLQGHDEGEPHREVFTVTDLTKQIDGVDTLVVWDQDLSHGHLLESELALFAQDDDGTVWLLGEYPEEFEHGKFHGAPDTWTTGHADAVAGIQMPAAPKPETGSYSEGYAPDIKFLDCGKVSKMGLATTVLAGRFDDVALIKEWSPRESRHEYQFKYYAPDVGLIRVGSKPKGGETLKLVKSVKLSSDDLERADEEAQKLNERACDTYDWFGCDIE